MKRRPCLRILLVLCCMSLVSNADALQDKKLETNLERNAFASIKSIDFEAETKDEVPDAWTKKGRPGFAAKVTDYSAMNGEQGLQMVSTVDGSAKQPAGALNYKLDPEVCCGKRIRFRALVKAEFDDEGQFVLWLREDLKSGEYGAFDNMADRPIKTGDWQQFEIVADISNGAKGIAVGFLLSGKGNVYIDDVVIEAVDESVAVTSTAGSSPMGPSALPGLFQINGSMQVTSGSPRARRGTADVTLLLPLPLVHRSQYPLTYNLKTTPEEALKSVRIYEDKPSNFVAEVILQDCSTHEKVDVEFNSTVMVLPTSFEDVPKTAPMPKSWPDEAKPWLTATWCVESDNNRVQDIAKEIRSETDDVLEIIQRVETRSKSIFGEAKGMVQNLTAVEALDKRGSCTSCGNLVAAILRASNVPARVLAGYPSWSGPLQTHYMVEAYVPGYGWYPIESTMCRSPWPNKNQINVSIVPPEYESKELAGQRVGIAGGVPYLSLTEIPNNENAYFTQGTIEGSPYCDHECKFVREFKATDVEWKAAADWATPRWSKWLESELVVEDGKVRFGPSSSEIGSQTPAQLIQDLAKSK